MSVPWPGGMVARPLDKADAPGWVALLTAIEGADGDGDFYDEDDLLEELADPLLDAGSQTLGLWDGTTMVGYATIGTRPHASEVDRIGFSGGVHPAWRRKGLGSALVEWAASASAALHALRNPDLTAELHVGANDAVEGKSALLRGAGFSPMRYFFDMERDLTSSPVPVVDDPDDLRVVTFDPAWGKALLTAHNEAFADHWGFSPRDEAYWRQWMSGSRAFRASLSHLAWDGDEVAAYVLAYEYVADTVATGRRALVVNQVGTRRAYRGRGLARTLLARTLAAGQSAGYAYAGLGVDAENPTGALGVYERLGFATRRTFVTYVRPLPV